MKKRSVIIATPLFPPDIGGPATHAKVIFNIFKKEDISVYVANFSEVTSIEKGSKLFMYTVLLFFNSIKAQTIIAFDELAVGLPSALVSFILRKKLILRIGGDRLWEKAVQEGKYDKPLPNFCEEKKAKEIYPILYRLVRFVMHRADQIIFPSAFYRDRAIFVYDIPASKTRVIENEQAVSFTTSLSKKRESLSFIYAGRFSKVKNLPRMISAFLLFAKNNPTAHLSLYGEGPEEKTIQSQLASQANITIHKPLSHAALIEKISESYACVLPSLSEVSPNFAFECNSLGTPIIITQYAGGLETIKNAYPVDPLSEESIYDAFSQVSSESHPPITAFSEKNNIFEKAWLSVLEQ